MSDIYTYGKDIKSMLYQRNLLIHQMVEAEANLTIQKTQVNDQINIIWNKRSQLLKQFEDYYKEYLNKSFEFEQLKKQVPDRYLVDSNNIIRAFNEYGNIVAIYDNNENAIIINYDSKDKIDAIYEGEEKKATFEYNDYGQLIAIIDDRGKRTEYKYDSTTLSTGNLISVTYSDRRKVAIAYTTDGSENITTVESSTIIDPLKEIKSQKSVLGYTNGKLSSVIDYSLAESIKKGNILGSARALEISRNTISYDLHQTSITDDKGKKTCYVFKNDGNVSMSYTMQDVVIEDSYVYDYKNASCSYMVKPKKNESNMITNNSSRAVSSSYLLQTIQGNTLDISNTDYIFSSFAKADSYTTAMRMKTEFYSYNMTSSISAKFELRADVIYPTITKQFICSYDYLNKNKQYIALPIMLDEDINGNAIIPTQINLYIDYSSNKGSCTFDTFTFCEAEWSYSDLDQYDNATFTETSWEKISNSKKVKSSTTYTYDNDQRVIKERTEKAIATNNGAIDKKYSVTNYEYNQSGNIFRVETYIEGEEATKGIDIAENVYDDLGNKIKEIKYNSLDSTTKFYSETELGENGKLLANIDETGENKTRLEYVDGTSLVKTSILPNGSKFSYGYDKNDEVTGITQSTADGEENSSKIYTDMGLVTEITSGLHKVNYEYDGKFRKTKVILDDNLVNAVEYAYDEATSSNGYIDKSTIKRNGVESETRTDRNGNLLSLKVKDNTNPQREFLLNTFDKSKQLSSVDKLSNSRTIYSYDSVMKERLASVSRTAGSITSDSGNVTNVSALTESNNYNELGQLSSRVITGEVNHAYGYTYKDNAGMDLENISLPSGLTVTPQNDVSTRSTGKILFNGETKIYGEYLSYLKVGDHGTNTISTMRYGNNTSAGYVISDSLKYKYDNCGNISEVWENGKLQTKYIYDSINRLIREDNKSLNKTYLFTYDNFGNILSKRMTNFTLKAAEEIEAYNDEIGYAYDGSFPDRLKRFGNQTITYNEKGLPNNYLGKSLEWSAIGQLTKVNGVNYIYDGYGKRVKKGDTLFTYDFGGRIIKQGNNLEFYYDGNGLSGLKYNNINYIYRKNAQGDITAMLDNSGNIVVKYIYDAWGNVTTLAESGYETLANTNPFRYRSYFYDTETNLYYLKSRYYDPCTGRFISQDDESYLSTESISGLNLYAYCLNNPVVLNDHDGNAPAWWEWLVSGLVIAVGVVLCATGVGTALGVSLLVAGGSMLASNIMSASGVNGKVASIISSALNIVAGVALLFTPFAAMGASMIGSGIGGIAGGYISKALGGRFETGAMIGSIVGGIVGGQVYKGVQALSASKAAAAAKIASTGKTNIIGKAHGSVEHQARIMEQVDKMRVAGKYSEIYLNKALKTVGLNGNQRPDIIGKLVDGSFDACEIASKTQILGSKLGNLLVAKVNLMQLNNLNVIFKPIIWLFG